MSSDSRKKPTKPDLGDFDRTQEIRVEATRGLSMRERLAQLHHLCLQSSQIKSVASR